MSEPDSQRSSRPRQPNKRERYPQPPEVHNPVVLPTGRRTPGFAYGRLLIALALVWLAAFTFESFGWIGATIVTILIILTHL